MASGVNVSDQCVQYYNELKTSRKYKYVFFKLDDDMKEVIVDTDRIGEPSATYDDFVAQIKSVANECRYAIYNFEWETKEGGKREKIVFYSWCPDTSQIKKKMVYAASKDTLRKKFVGLGAEVQGTSLDEVDYETILDKVAKGPGNQ